MSEPSPIPRIVAPLGRLFDFNGRSAPADFWPYMLLLVAIYVVGFALLVALPPHGIGSSVADMFVLVLVLILLAFAAVVRRLHDVGWSGRWMAAYLLMACAFSAFFFYWRYSLIHDPYGPANVSLFRLMPLLMIFSLAMNGIAILILIVCILPGTTGPNRYGPDPKGGGAL